MNRYGFSGKGNILIKAAVDGKYGVTYYAAEEPISYFTDVDIALAFESTSQVANSGVSKQIANIETKASTVRVSGVKITDSMLSMLYKKTQKTNIEKTEMLSILSQSGVAFLPFDENVNLNPNYIFVYKNKQRITDFVFDATGKKITGLEDGRYLVFIKKIIPQITSYTLENHGSPNLILEISMKGNINGVGAESIINFKRVKLITTPTLDFASDNPFVEELEFVVLNEKDSVEVYYV